MKKLASLILLTLVFPSALLWANTENGSTSIQKAIANALLADNLENKARKARESKNYNLAIKYYKEVIALAPYDFSSRFALGDTYKEKGMLDEAIAEYKNILDILPHNKYALLNLGSIHYKNNLLLEATNYFYEAGLECAEQGDKETLSKAYEGLKLTGETSKIKLLKANEWYYKGDKAFDAKKYGEAIKCFEKSINLGYNFAKVHKSLGLAYLEKDFSDLSADHFYRAGILYLEHGDRESALFAYNSLRLTSSSKLAKALFVKLYPEIK
jgi:tetratricopeptide (TPR) repeat protein